MKDFNAIVNGVKDQFSFNMEMEELQKMNKIN